MKLIVDAARCQGHVQCKFIAPALIELDEFGNAHPAADALAEHDEALAHLAAASCPERAIRVEP